MSALFVIEGGARSLVQDTGFKGSRGLGVPKSGVMDRDALALLNGLLGNPLDCEAIEVALTAPVLRAKGQVMIACNGALSGTITTPDGEVRDVKPWQSTCLFDGDVVRFTPPVGVGLIGIGGGIDRPKVLNSRSSYPRAGLGGAALAAGDEIATRFDVPIHVDGRKFADDIPTPTGPIRAVRGPQDRAFSEAAFSTLFNTNFDVTPEFDRMGLRLGGAVLEHQNGADMISDGITAGAIQVPGSGAPIVLLADAQTMGGYTKIATVIQADLPRFAHLRVGDQITFEEVSVTEAETALRENHAHLAALIDGVISAKPVGSVDLRELYSTNLISGMIDMTDPNTGENDEN